MTSRSVTSFVTLASIVLSAVAFAAGCTLAAPSAPSPSNPARTTTSFDGSFSYQGSQSHQFTVTEPGVVEIRLTAVGPLATMALGVSVGTWIDSVCTTAAITNNAARVGVLALSGTTTAGDYCVNVYDSGNVPSSSWTATYTVAVTYP